MYVRNIWICRKIEYPELQKFNRKLYALYMYGMFGLAKKLNVQNWENSKVNCVHYMNRMSGCVEKLNIQSCENLSENCVLYLRTVVISKKIECPELRKFYRKLCTLYTYGISGLAKNWMLKIAKIKQEIVYIICTEYHDLQKNLISRIA